MAARNYDLVEVNADAVKKDLERFGLDMKTLSKKMGKEEPFISSTLRRGRVTRSLVEGIEDALFADRGKYTIELDEAVEKSTEPQEAKLSEGMGILLKQIKSSVEMLPSVENVASFIGPVSAQITDIRTEMAEQKAVLQDILQKQKEMTTLAARILSAMERRQG